MNVLIAEDSKSYRLLLKAYLDQLGHEVTAVTDGQQALDVFQQQGNALDLILMDVEMPVVNGIEAVESIRTIQQTADIEWTPVIFLSASTDEADLEASIASGGDDYLVKPVSQRVLSAKMLAMERIIKMRQRLIQANSELKALASVDPLTGLYNRRHFERIAHEEIRKAYRHGRNLCLAILDLDHFKSINDGYGHDAGDKTLITVGSAVRAALRSGDLFARLGGEEFGLLITECDHSSIIPVLERYREIIASQSIPLENGDTIQVTTSVGACLLGDSQREDFSQLYKQADIALYRSKHNGRNRVTLSSAGSER
ncbi:Histidine kinase [Saliniradius amylolyticus]|uniref:diguanylate cyclase n=1 Tax=Saliniradius amylolyticus TaxID=2183582 RepID=A0A2S2E6G3_9ALTE|nr:diguanylate cyclase [Saliniradius amylolyticus]AWL13244.1 Histidine kinase [Saliniradius amylolyticus]